MRCCVNKFQIDCTTKGDATTVAAHFSRVRLPTSEGDHDAEDLHAVAAHVHRGVGFRVKDLGFRA